MYIVGAEDYNLTLFGATTDSTRAVVDTGCAKSCCTSVWAATMVRNHPDRKKEKKCEQTPFQFGAGKRKVSEKMLLVRSKLGSAEATLSFFCLDDCNIPPLISSSTLSKLSADILYGRGKINFNKIKSSVDIDTSKSHITIDLIGGEVERGSTAAPSSSVKANYTATDQDYDWNY